MTINEAKQALRTNIKGLKKLAQEGKIVISKDDRNVDIVDLSIQKNKDYFGSEDRAS